MRSIAAIGASNVVGCDQHADATDANENADDLREMVSDTQEDSRDQHDDYYGPEVDQLCTKDSGITIGDDCEVVALDIHKGKDEVAPAVLV